MNFLKKDLNAYLSVNTRRYFLLSVIFTNLIKKTITSVYWTFVNGDPSRYKMVYSSLKLYVKETDIDGGPPPGVHVPLFGPVQFDGHVLFSGRVPFGGNVPFMDGRVPFGGIVPLNGCLPGNPPPPVNLGSNTKVSLVII
jgi:hypothetical protein